MESVVLETSMGDIQLELYWDHAPKTCKNFAELAKRGYYNGVVFHRIIADFMVQSGDPTGTGRGGTSIYGQKFQDEIHPELRFTGAGILAMANSGPNTNGSQFFLTLAPTPFLDNKHTIFGRVSSGMRVLQRLGAVGTDAQDRPREDQTRFLRLHRSEVNCESRFLRTDGQPSIPLYVEGGQGLRCRLLPLSTTRD
ncbi:Peptidyl-prolyl cis-trans isomerase-like 1 [Abortiporus biennis]